MQAIKETLELTVVTLKAAVYFPDRIFWAAAVLCSSTTRHWTNAAEQTVHLYECFILTFMLEALKTFLLQNTFPRTGEYCVQSVLVFQHFSEWLHSRKTILPWKQTLFAESASPGNQSVSPSWQWDLNRLKFRSPIT